MIRLSGFIFILLLLIYSSWTTFWGKERISLRSPGGSKLTSNISASAIIQLRNNMDSEVIYTSSQRVRLQGQNIERNPASVGSGSGFGELVPFVKNIATGETAVVFVDKTGGFFTDYIKLIPGDNNFYIEFHNGDKVVSKKSIVVKYM